MTWNKLARWAGVTAFSAIIPAAAMATTRHARLTHPTTAPSALTSKHIKPLAAKKGVASKLKARTVKPTQLKTTKHAAVAFKSKKAATSSKLVARKGAVSKLTTKKHVATKLKSTKTKAHALTSHKPTAKRAVKVTPVVPTM